MINDETSYPFEKSGYNCIDNTSNAVYSKNYHPSIVRSSGKCEGFKQLPATINCTVKGPNDGDTLRLCDCIAPGEDTPLQLKELDKKYVNKSSFCAANVAL